MIRLKDQRHPLAFHLGVALDLADHEQFSLDLIKKVAAQVQVSHLATLEAKGELHLVAFLEEVAGAVHLDQQIVVADADRVDVDLLEPACARAGAGFIFFFLVVVAPLALIHFSAEGRAGLGGDFNQVESGFARHAQGLRRGYDPDLILLVVDEPNRRNADLLIVAKIGRNGVGLLGQFWGTDTRPESFIRRAGQWVCNTSHSGPQSPRRPAVGAARPPAPSGRRRTDLTIKYRAVTTGFYSWAAQKPNSITESCFFIGLIMRWPMHFCKNQVAGIFGKIAGKIAGKALENALQHLIGFLASLAAGMDLGKSQHQVGRGYIHLLTAIARGMACGNRENSRSLDDFFQRGRSCAA